jgi:hypothetical protein
MPVDRLSDERVELLVPKLLNEYKYGYAYEVFLCSNRESLRLLRLFQILRLAEGK